MMLQVNPDDRPQASEIVKFVERLGKVSPPSDTAADEQSSIDAKKSLLRTIEIPADLGQIEAVLPRPNYLSAASMGFNRHISKSLNAPPKSALPSIKSSPVSARAPQDQPDPRRADRSRPQAAGAELRPAAQSHRNPEAQAEAPRAAQRQASDSFARETRARVCSGKGPGARQAA